MNNKKSFKIFTSFFFLSYIANVLSGCSNSEASQEANTNNDEEITPLASSEIASSTINISPRCIGCGRCAQIDSEHFSVRGHHASIISQENTDSDALLEAIMACPEDAISLS